MNQVSFLEDFTAPHVTDATARAADAISTSRGYDEGYAAGWNDALVAEAKAEEKSLRDMAVALQETGFTYFEARQHVLKSLQPLLKAISAVILPKLAQASLGPQIVETLEALAKSIEAPIEILCPPSAEASVREICEAHIKFPVTISTETSLAEQQVLFRYADGSSDLDMSRCVAEIQTAISEFYSSLNAEEERYA